MHTLTELAAAKINWSLGITGLREDGYHFIETVMQRVSLYDTITITQAKRDSLISNGNLPQDEKNIALKAWLLLKKDLGLNQCLEIKIKKEIPVSAGLAGGSADAAAVLKAANRYFKLGLNNEYLAGLGLSLGADIPFCLLGEAALARGIGEILTPLKGLPVYYLVVANPGVGVSTPEIFKEYDKLNIKSQIKTGDLIKALKTGDIIKISSLMENHLEAAALKKYPVIKKLKENMASLGLYPLMSGSGATVFGLAQNLPLAKKAAEALKNDWPFIRTAQTL